MPRYAPLPAVVMLAAFGAMAVAGLERAMLPWVVLFYAIAFAALLWCYFRQRALLDRPATILLWAVLFRLVLLFVMPDLSDDYYRYVWDGRLTTQGVNPYRYTPADDAVRDFRAGYPFERINSPGYYSIYPPLSQCVFTVGGWLYPSLGLAGAFIAIKLVYVVLELAGIALMLAAAKRFAAIGATGRWPASAQAGCSVPVNKRSVSQPTTRTPLPGGGESTRVAHVALYAWNPLAVMAFAGQGHSEAGLVFGMSLAVYALVAGRAAVSWLGLALAGMAKLVPFAAVPLWLRQTRGRGAWLGLVAVVALGAPFWFAALPINFVRSLRLYVQQFEFNAGLYYAVKSAAYALSGHDLSKWIGPAMAGAFFVIACVIYIRAAADTPARLLRATMLLLTAYLLCTTTVHPWYIIWPLVLVPFTPLLRWAWLWVSFASVATYFAYPPWSWHLDPWCKPHPLIVAFVWGGFFLLALLRPSAQRQLH